MKNQLSKGVLGDFSNGENHQWKTVGSATHKKKCMKISCSIIQQALHQSWLTEIWKFCFYSLHSPQDLNSPKKMFPGSSSKQKRIKV